MDNPNKDYEELQKIPAIPLKKKQVILEKFTPISDTDKINKKLDLLTKRLENLEMLFDRQINNLRKLKNSFNQERNDHGDNHRSKIVSK